MQIAQDDMKAIVAHIRINDPDAAIRMYEKIKASIGKLADFPLMGPVPLDRKIAELYCPRSQFSRVKIYSIFRIERLESTL